LGDYERYFSDNKKYATMAIAQFVEAARMNYPDYGIKNGEPFWWWEFKNGDRYYSKTKPRGSQVTQSPFWKRILDIEDDIQSFTAYKETVEDDIHAIISEIELLLEDFDELVTVPAGQQIADEDEDVDKENRYGWLEDMLWTMQDIDFSIDDDLEGDALQKRLDDITYEVNRIEYGGE